MATTQQPLLYTPKTNFSYCKAAKILCIILSLAAIVGPITLASIKLINYGFSSSSSSLSAHIRDPVHHPLSSYNVKSMQMILQQSALSIKDTLEMTKNLNRRINDQREAAALSDCLELMDLAMDRVMDSMVALENLTAQSQFDVHAWLSSVLTNHVTCMDGLNGPSRPIMEPWLNELISRARTSLAAVVAVAPPPPTEEEFWQRSLVGEFPEWVTGSDRKLLKSLPKGVKANITVAQDGSGNNRTIREAVASAPDNYKNRFVIYVKNGKYKENVVIGKNKKNIMLVGDGMSSTIITGSLNFVDGQTILQSATVAVLGDGFIAQDIWFQNTAGPVKRQAVALRVGAHKSVINRCRIEGYQDTLYAHCLCQFYRDCYITGTVDFIFGDAAVVLQNCRLVLRKPMNGQQNVITAQGRTDPNQNTGTSIQNCDIKPGSDLEPVKGLVKSYLGRPWKQYSRTVVMESNIGNLIDPAGWLEMKGTFALETLYYGEYLNRGPGAGTSKRVNWTGYHRAMSEAEASKFTVANLIQGGVWLKSTGVAYTEGL